MFKLSKRKAHVTNLNSRPEKHGERNVPAFDLSVEVAIRNKEIAEYLSVPADVVSAMYSDGQLIAGALFPLAVHREIDEVRAVIDDDEGDVMRFDKCRVKGIKIVKMGENEVQALMAFKLQLSVDPEELGEDADYIIARLNYAQKADISVELESAQGDLFREEEEEEAA